MKKKNNFWNLGVAAALVLLFGIGMGIKGLCPSTCKATGDLTVAAAKVDFNKSDIQHFAKCGDGKNTQKAKKCGSGKCGKGKCGGGKCGQGKCGGGKCGADKAKKEAKDPKKAVQDTTKKAVDKATKDAKKDAKKAKDDAKKHKCGGGKCGGGKCGGGKCGGGKCGK